MTTTSWTTTKLKYLAAEPIVNGLGEAAQDGDPAWPRYVRTTDISSPTTLDPLKRVTLPPALASGAVLLKDDLLLCAAGSLGKTYLHQTDERACYAGYLVRFRPAKEHVDPRFVSYWSQSQPFLDQIAVGAVRSTIDNFSAGKFRAMSIAVPELQEQRRIADFLDDQVARLNHLMELRLCQKRLMEERFEDLRESLIENPNIHRPLRDMTSTSRPINYGVLMPGPYVAGGIPLIEAGDCTRGEIALDQLRRTEPAIEKEFTRSRLAEGDCVMAIRGSIGAVRSVPRLSETVNVTRDAARIVPQPEMVRTGYLRHALSTRRAQEWLKLRAGGAAVKGINIADLRKLPVALPTLAQQTRVEARLASEEDACLLLTRQLAEARYLVDERKQALITVAVTGQLDVTTARPAGVA